MGNNNNQNALSQNDLDKIAGLMDDRFGAMASKDDLKPLATKEDLKDLKNYINDGVETIMQGIDNIAEKLAEKERVDKLEKWAQEVGEKVGVKLKI